MRPIIKVENLGKRYRLGARALINPTLREAVVSGIRSPYRYFVRRAGDQFLWALNDVSFEVAPGEVVGIIGRNGAGKSTLLKILSRITRPTTGAADLYGRVGSLLEVGTGFHPDLTGRENIFLNGAIIGMKREEIERKFDEIVAFAEVDRFLDTPVKHYSSGMYLRLAFSVAAHLEPEILILDEVLAVGDAEFQKKCLRKMRDAGGQGRAVLFVSHNMTAVEQLCKRVLLIRSGRLVDEGKAGAVIAKYLSDAAEAEDGDFDLSDHPARMARCSPIIRRLTLYGPDGSPTMRFHPGERMVAEILIDPPAPLKNPRVALAVEDERGRRITTLASYFEASLLGDIEAPCRIRCTLPALKLGAGRYLLSVSIANKYQGMIDGLHNAAWMEVVWRNSYGNGEDYSPIYGPVLTSSVWERVD